MNNLQQNFGLSGGERKVYHISPFRRFALWLAFSPFFLIAAIPIIFSSTPGEAELGFLMFAFLGTLGLILQLLFIERAKLTISPAGVKLKQTGYTLETTWDNIASLRLTSGSEAFITAAPLTGKGATLLTRASNVRVARAPFYDERQSALIETKRLIPIEAFGWHFKHGALAADILHFAPHLSKTLEGCAPSK